ncbi:hypothetical protein JHK82_024829 [Glycine max]|nr:hypothetical protein JHK85_025438 [Glycine max]KAG5133641.1 hypothetical protein JHK82_024829 [Glycine max]
MSSRVLGCKRSRKRAIVVVVLEKEKEKVWGIWRGGKVESNMSGLREDRISKSEDGPSLQEEYSTISIRTLSAGYLEIGESAVEGAIRETREEANADCFGGRVGFVREMMGNEYCNQIIFSLNTTTLHYIIPYAIGASARLKLGWYVIFVTSSPSKVHKVVDACKNALRGLHNNKITERELDRMEEISRFKNEVRKARQKRNKGEGSTRTESQK